MGYIECPPALETIAKNIELVKTRITEACKRSGRTPESVELIAVSKTFQPDHIREAARAGVLDFGENYVQEFRAKQEELGGLGLRWHFIGHLQTNKVKYIIDSVHLVHSFDSAKLAREIQKRAVRPVDVLIEVHSTNEPSKSGVMPADVISLVKEVAEFDKVRVRGLMTMGPFSDDPNDSRPSFRLVTELKETIRRESIPNVSMDHLSMGMTHDFEVAIEEGATLIRIGTAIFGERKTR